LVLDEGEVKVLTAENLIKLCSSTRLLLGKPLTV
jgi:hypothetical protein